MPDHRDRHAVAGQLISFVVVGGQLEAILQSHQSSGFACRKQAGANPIPLYHHYRLTAGPSCGSSETTSNIVEPNFGSLNFPSGAAESRTFVYGTYYTKSGVLRRPHLGQV